MCRGFLLDMGADVNKQGGYYGNALLHKVADVDPQDEDNRNKIQKKSRQQDSAENDKADTAATNQS